MFINLFNLFLFLFLFLFMAFVLLFNQNFELILDLVLYSYYLNDFKIFFFVDYFSIIFLMVVCLISFFTFLFSKSYMSSDIFKVEFLFLTFLFILSMIFLIMSLDFWMVLLGWDGLGLISFLLVIYYSSGVSYYSGFVTVMMNRLGDIGLILSLFFLMVNSSFSFFVIEFNFSLFEIYILMLLTAVMTKTAQFPFSVWLPLAMAAPTPISALVHSSTLVTSGIYLLFRFKIIKNCNFKFLFLIVFLFMLTLLMSGLSAIFELDLKKIIALSTMSQISLMILIVVLGFEMLGFFHLMTHALFKAMLFLCSGVFIHEMNLNQDIRNMALVFKNNSLVSLIFLICNFSLMGIPFLSGFYSKDLILECVYTMNLNIFYLLFIVLSFILTMYYSIRLIYMSVISGKKSFKICFVKNWDLMYSSLLICVFGVVFFGSLMNWVLLDMLDLLVLNYWVKLLNFSLMIFVMSTLFYMNILFLNKEYLYFYMSMFYLTFFLGSVSNFWMSNMIQKFELSEFYLSKFYSTSMMKIMLKMNFYIIYMKMMSFILMIMVMVVLLFLMI